MKIDKLQASMLDYPSQDMTISIYFVGCSHFCDGCSSPQLADPEGPGTILTAKELLDKIDAYNNGKKKIKTITLVGGDPLHESNIEDVIEFCKLAKDKYDICIYTGYTMKYVERWHYGVLSHLAYIITGRYERNVSVLSEKTDEYMQLASMNQEIHKNLCNPEYVQYEQISVNARYYFDSKNVN